MKQFFPCVASSILLAGTAHAQVTFSVGLNVATAHFPDSYPGNSYASRSGFEAGLTGNVQFGHFALQSNLLFIPKGYHLNSPLQYADFGWDTGEVNQQVRLNVAFMLGRDEQGLQVFAGPYVSMLVGGNYASQTHVQGLSSDIEFSGKIKPANTVSATDTDWYSRRFDDGVQAGLGYRYHGWQVQAGYSLGLRNLAVLYQGANYSYRGHPSYNQTWQVALSYLVGPKTKS